MTTYELVVLLHPDLEIDLDTPLKKIEKLIDGAGGKIVKHDNWGKRKLAYPIRRQEFALYGYWEVDLPADGIARIDRGLNMTEEVLRHLLTRHIEPPEPKEDAPKKNEADSDDANKAAADKVKVKEDK
jgi:small subunit ribosomal protein S6